MNVVSLEDRFCQLLREHGKIVLKVASTYAWEFEDRRDLVQEIHARLWKAFPTSVDYEKVSSPDGIVGVLRFGDRVQNRVQFRCAQSGFELVRSDT